MLVNLEPFGRLGNRLFLGAHLVAFSLKHEVPLLNLGFGEYAGDFPWFEGNRAFAFPWRETGTLADAAKLTRGHRWLERMPWAKRFRYWGTEDWNFDARDTTILTKPLLEGRDVYFRSWLFRGKASVARHRSTILEVFRPPLELAEEVETQVDRWRSDSPLLVGVHVRWEDYRGTDYFIDQPGFRARMEGLRGLWPDRTVRFVLFSNESLPTDGWGDLDVARSSGTSPLYDLTAMAHCDVLIGPPSTFSGWASFYGQVPLLTLTSGRTTPSLEDFHVVDG